MKVECYYWNSFFTHLPTKGVKLRQVVEANTITEAGYKNLLMWWHYSHNEKQSNEKSTKWGRSSTRTLGPSTGGSSSV